MQRVCGSAISIYIDAMARNPFERIAELSRGLRADQLVVISVRAALRAFPSYNTHGGKSKRSILALMRALSDLYYISKGRLRGFYGVIDIAQTQKELLPFARNLDFDNPEIKIYVGGENPRDDLTLNHYVSLLAIPEAIYHCLDYYYLKCNPQALSADFDRRYLIKAIFLCFMSLTRDDVREDVIVRFIDAVRRDVSFLYGNATEKLLDEPLWTENVTPPVIAEGWQKLRASLIRSNGNWDVWTDWFDGITHGKDPYTTYIRRFDAYNSSLLPPIWRRGVNFINNQIRLLMEHSENFRDVDEPLVPHQRRAPLMTFERDGLVARVAPAAPAGTTAAREARRLSGYLALREALDDFDTVFSPDNQRGIKLALSRVRSALGGNYEELDPIRAGVAAERLHQYALRADELFLPDMAAELVSLNTNLAINLAHFDEWVDYRNELASDPAVSTRELTLSVDVAVNLQASTLLEREVKDGLREQTTSLSGDVDHVPANESERRTLIRSVTNVLATVSKMALRGCKFIGSKMRDGAGDLIQHGTEAAGMMLLMALGAKLLELAQQSQLYAFLAPVLTYIARFKPK